MGHSHGHHHTSDTKNVKQAFFLNLAFTLLEIVGGIFTNSVAILSDAVHDLGDSFSLGLAWYFQKVSNKESDRKYTYGYKRYSVVGAIINSIILLIGSTVMFYEAIPRIIHPEASDAPGIIFLAIIGVIVNGIAASRLSKGHSLNERAVMLHLMEDVLGWIAVLIGGIIMYFFDLPIIDPILSILISVYVLYNVFKNLKSVLKIILQGTPENVNIKEIEQELSKNDHIIGFHDLHIWSLDGEYNILSVHLEVSEDLSYAQVQELKICLRKSLKPLAIHHATLEVDGDQQNCEFKD